MSGHETPGFIAACTSRDDLSTALYLQRVNVTSSTPTSTSKCQLVSHTFKPWQRSKEEGAVSQASVSWRATRSTRGHDRKKRVLYLKQVVCFL
jgi:hypothetical protein